MVNKEKAYIFLDGDGIGDQVELYLLEEDIDAAVLVQSQVQSTMKLLQKQIIHKQECEMLMYGCDELLFTMQVGAIEIAYIEKMRKTFYDRTGFTMSGGIGTSLRQAMESLRRAKLSGKNRIVSSA